MKNRVTLDREVKALQKFPLSTAAHQRLVSADREAVRRAKDQRGTLTPKNMHGGFNFTRAPHMQHDCTSDMVRANQGTAVAALPRDLDVKPGAF